MLDKMCEGCVLQSENDELGEICGVYVVPPSTWVRAGKCPYNYTEKVVKTKKRVGQQKQKGNK